jgi:hypothetical protein
MEQAVTRWSQSGVSLALNVIVSDQGESIAPGPSIFSFLNVAAARFSNHSFSDRLPHPP